MNDAKPIGVRVVRPYVDAESFLDAEAEFSSKGHVMLVGAKARPVGTSVRFEVQLQGGEVLMRAEGRVVEVTEVLGETALRVKLSRIDARTKLMLAKIVEHKQRRAESKASADSTRELSAVAADVHVEVQEAAPSSAGPVSESVPESLPPASLHGSSQDAAPESQAPAADTSELDIDVAVESVRNLAQLTAESAPSSPLSGIDAPRSREELLARLRRRRLS